MRATPFFRKGEYNRAENEPPFAYTPGSRDNAESSMTIEDIYENFEFVDDWEERYRYVIELGRDLPPFAEDEHTAENKVNGCVSQVWLVSETSRTGDVPILSFRGDSDAMIVRGLIAILFALYSGKSADDILSIDADAAFRRLGLNEHLTPQRSNGFAAMVSRIRADATKAKTQVT